MNTKALAVAASLWVPMVASAATDATVTDQQEALSARLEQILAKNGISIGGSFRGEVGASAMDGNYTKPVRRNDEQIAFTSVDFDLRARPNSSTTARAVFRLHLDDPNFFGSPYVPLDTRWLSLDGGFLDMFYYHLGNLQAKWSPLVMNATEPGFLYTPRLFAQQQKEVEAERFIGGGVRNLQGANLGLRAAVPSLQIDSFDVSLLASKLLSAGPIGSIASISTTKRQLSGDGVTGFPDSLANFDRWALGGKANVAFLKGFNIGGSFIQTKDLRSTFGTIDTANTIVRNHYTRRDSVVAGVVQKTEAKDSTVWKKSKTGATATSPEIGRDSIIQNGYVVSGVFGAKIGNFLDNKNLIADLDVEFARSAWDYFSGRDLRDAKSGLDSVAGGTNRKYYGTSDTGFFTPRYITKAGIALNVGVNAGWKTEGWTAKAKFGYLMNDSAFRSDLAQNPVFSPAMGRIFNTEQDVYDPTTGVYTMLRHYSSFDALYHSVHRYVPEDQNEYAKSPYDKIAYSNYVGGGIVPGLGKWTSSVSKLSKAFKAAETTLVVAKVAAALPGATGTDTTAVNDAQVALATAKGNLYISALESSGWDRDLQMVLPAGEASANRVGPKFGLDFDLMQGGVEVKVNGYMLQEAKGSVLDSGTQLVAAKAKFQQIEAGSRVRVDRFINGWNLPIELTGSFGLSSAKGGTSLDYTSTAINAGLYVGVFKRVSVLAGFQQITGKDKAFLVDRNQSNMAGGLEFKVQEGAYLLGMYNLIKTEFPNASEYNFDQSIWSTKISVSF